MKKLVLLIAIGFCIISCGQGSGNKTDGKMDQNTEDSRETLTEGELDFALEFINGYIDYCNNYDENISLVDWVNSNKLVTAEFKKELSRIIDEANREDPEWGLGADPILDAQDYDESGLEIASFDPLSNLIYLRGKKWNEFEVKMRAKSVDGKWLVDGSGFINMPQENSPEENSAEG